MPPRSRHRVGRPYRRAREQMFLIYGRTCWLCGHTDDNVTDADHLVPISVDSTQPIDPHAMRPAHGVLGCLTCGVKCNQVKGNKAGLPALVTSEDW